METTYYTLTARHVVVSGGAVAQAAGDDRRCLVFARTAAPSEQRGRVIDLEQWRAARGEDTVPAPAEASVSAPAAPRSRRTRRLDPASALELLATLSVVAVTALLAVRVLLF